MDRRLFILPLVLLACGTPEPETTTEVPTQESEKETGTGRTIDLSQHDLPLAVHIDPQLLGSDSATVTWNDAIGRLEVDAGERFLITITEEEGDMERLKADLDRDMLRKNTIIQETPGLLIYRSEFPDETIAFVHFYRIITHAGRTFVVQSHDQGRFNQADIERMANAVAPAESV